MSGSNQLGMNKDTVKPKTSTVNKRPPIPISTLFPRRNSSGMSTLSEKSDNLPVNSLTEFKRTMAQVKQKTLLSIKSNGIPTTREACIDYTLDVVINNLILNGNLDPDKAQKMTTPLMKSQIATICEKMIGRQASPGKISSLTKKKSTRKTATPWSLRKQSQQRQKWVIQQQTLSDPGSVQSSTQAIPKKTNRVAATKQVKGESLETLNLSSDREKCKKTTVSKSARTSKKSSNRFSQLKRSLPILPALSDSKPVNLLNSNSCTPLQLWSGTPSSNQSSQRNLRVLSNHKFVPSISTEPATDSEQKSERCVQSKAAEISRGVQAIKRKYPRHQEPSELDQLFSSSNLNLTGESKYSTQAAPELSCSQSNTVKTLQASRSSQNVPSLFPIKNDYQILVDMTGFRNEEISMEVEVESRQLIFLGVRPKREKLNCRRVTEIVEVPPDVDMENLKIGRQVDGFVLIEQIYNA